MAAAASSTHPYRSAEARERYLAFYDKRAARWPLPHESREVQTARGTTYVHLHGPADAPPLVLLPGRGCNLFTFEPAFIERLSADYRLITPDSPQDFGRSVSIGRPAGIADYTTWLDSLFDGLGLDGGINFVGISRGAWMTAEYQLVAPERIGRVVWLEPGSILLPYSPKLWASSFYGLPMMISPSTATAKLGLRPMMPELAKADGHLGELFERFAEELAMGIGCFDLKSLDFWRLERQLTDEELRSINAPTLYLAGELERLYSVPKATDRLRRAAPQISVEVVPDVGHDLITVHPEMLAERVLGWMRE